MDTSKVVSLPCDTKDGKRYTIYCVYDKDKIKSFRIIEEYTKDSGEKEFKQTKYIPPDPDVLKTIDMVIHKVLYEISKES